MTNSIRFGQRILFEIRGNDRLTGEKLRKIAKEVDHVAQAEGFSTADVTHRQIYSQTLPKSRIIKRIFELSTDKLADKHQDAVRTHLLAKMRYLLPVTKPHAKAGIFLMDFLPKEIQRLSRAQVQQTLLKLGSEINANKLDFEPELKPIDTALAPKSLNVEAKTPQG